MSKRTYEKYSPEHKKKLMKKSKSELVDTIFKSWKEHGKILYDYIGLQIGDKENVIAELKTITQKMEEMKKPIKCPNCGETDITASCKNCIMDWGVNK